MADVYLFNGVLALFTAWYAPVCVRAALAILLHRVVTGGGANAIAV